MENFEAETVSGKIRTICENYFPDKKISAIKEIRALTDLGLLHSKLLVEHEFEATRLRCEREQKRQAWLEEGRQNGWVE
jgi:ribosomal protein L7/L12